MATDARDLQPKCEDYHSDDSDDHVYQEAFRRSPGVAAGQANVAAKRSHPSDLGTDKPVAEKVVNVDLQSDSGYSSHTAATMSSADSAPSAKVSQSPPAAPASAAPLPPPSPATTTNRRPTLVTDDEKPSSQSSPRKPLHRGGSISSKRPPASRRQTVTGDICRDPNCSRCGPNALPNHRRRPGPTDSGLDISYAPSQRSDPAPSVRAPPSPTYSRQPAPYAHGSAILQPAQTRRRSSSHTRRPVSYQGDPGPGYWVPGMPVPYPSPPQEHLHGHGPPPSMSAHYNMQHPQQMSSLMLGATPPNYYGHANPMAQMAQMSQISPPYEQQRPPLSARNSSNYQTRGRPASTLITYDRGDQPMPSARYPDAPQSAREPRTYTSQFESDSDDSESSEEEYVPRARNDRELMPPPKIKSSRERPVLRHANTTQAVNKRRESLTQSQMLPDRTRDPRASRVSTATLSRAPSTNRRPALIQHTQSAQETARAGKAIVESSKGRRQSYQAYERERDYDRGYDKDYLKEQKRRNRDSKMYYRDEREDAIVIPQRSRRRDDYPVKETQTFMDAEAYQQRARGSVDPLTDQIHKAAKRASRVPSGPSEGSSRSEDRKTRVSQSNRTAMTNGNSNNEIRLRVDASAPLSLSFNGDMEGRTLQINPAEDGMADIVIGSHGENTYRSERGGSIAGDRKSRVGGSVRREAEELSTRSSRSGQGRREGERERRVLRRRRDTDYH